MILVSFYKIFSLLLFFLVQKLVALSLPYTVLVSTFEPMIKCEIGNTDQSSFSGLDIEMFDEIASKLNWNKSDYKYECIGIGDLMTNLIKTDQYLGFLGGLTIDSEREQEGYVFSYPMWNTGTSVIYQSTDNFWFQVKVLSGKVSLYIPLTALCIGILQYYFEKREHTLEQFIWNGFTSIFFITTINLKRSSSRLIQIVFWFAMLIISSNYIAKMTNLLTIDNTWSKIKSASDLNKHRIMTYSLYLPQLLHYGSIPVTSDFGTPGGVFDDIPLELVRSNQSREDEYKVDAFVLDDAQAQMMSYTNCDLFIACQQFYQFSYGIGYYKTQDSAIIQQINEKILEITTTSEKNINTLVSKMYASCEKGDTGDAITLKQVGGLFVIQGIAIGAALIIFFITHIPLYRVLQRKLIKLNVLSKDPSNETVLYGDENIVNNIKTVAKEQLQQFSTILEERLDEMDENIIKFYEILLNEEQLKKNKIITEAEYLSSRQAGAVNFKGSQPLPSTKRKDEHHVDSHNLEESNTQRSKWLPDKHKKLNKSTNEAQDGPIETEMIVFTQASEQ